MSFNTIYNSLHINLHWVSREKGTSVIWQSPSKSLRHLQTPACSPQAPLCQFLTYQKEPERLWQESLAQLAPEALVSKLHWVVMQTYRGLIIKQMAQNCFGGTGRKSQVMSLIDVIKHFSCPTSFFQSQSKQLRHAAKSF